MSGNGTRKFNLFFYQLRFGRTRKKVLRHPPSPRLFSNGDDDNNDNDDDDDVNKMFFNLQLEW